MRYLETKEQSAEWLRLTLAAMAQHDAPFNPVHFAVWYEHLGGMNARLSDAMQKRLAAEPRLSADTVNRLYRDHIAEIDEASADRIAGDFRRLMTTLSASAASTGETAGSFGEKLKGLNGALEKAEPSALRQQLGIALTATSEMESSLSTLRRQVDASQREIEQLQQDLKRTREDAMLDPLTQVLNRKGFDQRMRALLAEPAASGAEHCLVMLDIDHFKKVNDTHGHLIGDKVIQGVGAILRASSQEAQAEPARYGGEEFALIVPHGTVRRGSQLAELVRARTKAMKIRNRNTQEVMLTVTISAGVASLRPGESANDFIARADAALYQSKQAGRDRVTVA